MLRFAAVVWLAIPIVAISGSARAADQLIASDVVDAQEDAEESSPRGPRRGEEEFGLWPMPHIGWSFQTSVVPDCFGIHIFQLPLGIVDIKFFSFEVNLRYRPLGDLEDTGTRFQLLRFDLNLIPLEVFTAGIGVNALPYFRFNAEDFLFGFDPGVHVRLFQVLELRFSVLLEPANETAQPHLTLGARIPMTY